MVRMGPVVPRPEQWPLEPPEPAGLGPPWAERATGPAPCAVLATKFWLGRLWHFLLQLLLGLALSWRLGLRRWL